MFTALILAIWAYLCVFDILGPTFFLGWRPLIGGFGAGILVGDVQTGMMVGATLELMALGVYTYGGATIPDFTVGSILGTYFAVSSGQGFEQGVALAIPAALLLTQVDIFGRFINFVFVHRADAYAEAGDAAGFERMMVLFSHIIWGLSRAIPVFLAVAFGETLVTSISNFFDANPWFSNGITTVGGVLPALGFAMLLKIMPVEQYPAFLLLGFVMFAYLEMPLVGIALAGFAIALVFQQLKYRGQEA
jgi:PTS system mannose-specific IIC component